MFVEGGYTLTGEEQEADAILVNTNRPHITYTPMVVHGSTVDFSGSRQLPGGPERVVFLDSAPVLRPAGRAALPVRGASQGTGKVYAPETYSVGPWCRTPEIPAIWFWRGPPFSLTSHFLMKFMIFKRAVPFCITSWEGAVSAPRVPD